MMKKLAFLLVIILCFSLLGCGTTEKENTAQTTQQPTESIIATDVPPETTVPSVAPTQGDTGGSDIARLGVSSLEKYEKHFAENRGYPDSFITYEDIQALGAFKSFVCQSYSLHEAGKKEYICYDYKLTVDGYEFVFGVLPVKGIFDSGKKFEFEDAKNTMNPLDLRTNNTEAVRGEVICDEYQYVYVLGELNSIKWIIGETQITIWSDSGWPENDPNTLIGRMLIWDTAEEALGELREKIDGKLKNLKYPD